MYQRQVSFGEAINLAIGRNYCNFSGRASRSEYWWFALFTFIIGLVLTPFSLSDSTFGTIVCSVVNLALLLPSLGIAVRCLHDIGKSGWWIFITLIPLVGIIIFIVWMCKDSMPDNQYGPTPHMVR